MDSRVRRRDLLGWGIGVAGTAVTGGWSVGCHRRESAQPQPPAEISPGNADGRVAVQRCRTYQLQDFRRQLDAGLDAIGGIESLVRGKTVTIKINLTGFEQRAFPELQACQTHPTSLAALCSAFVEAGAKELVVVEAMPCPGEFRDILVKCGWDVESIRSAGDHRVTFEDVRHRGAWPSYSRLRVPWGGFLYPAFEMNQRFEKTDVLVSLAKLKQHSSAGVTCAVKNLFGNTPASLYGDDAPNEEAFRGRLAIFHGGRKVPDGVPPELDDGLSGARRGRVPRITADIYGARPADLSIVDGVCSVRGGEGPWAGRLELVEPGVLVVGRNGVSTDAVCTAIMGFDPQAPYGCPPFQSENHLSLLASVGLGTNDLNRIEILGLPLEQAVFRYSGSPAS